MQTQLTLFDYMTKNLENTVKNLEKRTIAYLFEEKNRIYAKNGSVG